MKKILNFFMMFFLLYIILQIIIFSSEVKAAILFSFDIFKNNVFPNLFPFMVVSGLLINYGFVELCSKLFTPLFRKLFKISGNAAYVLIMSMLSGFPSNSKYTKELYLKGNLSEKEATKVLMFTHFSNPLFIMGMIASFLDFKTALTILICHYSGNIIIGLLFRNCFVSNNNCELKKIDKIAFGSVLSSSISNSINTLLLIFGTITVFLIITCIIRLNLNLSSFYNALIGGILEMTQGLKMISLLEISLKVKAILMTMILSFGGISVHMQVLSIISDTKIKYQPFLIARLLHSAISGIMIYFIL